MTVHFEFQKISEDGKAAIFKNKPPCEIYKNFEGEMAERWPRFAGRLEGSLKHSVGLHLSNNQFDMITPSHTFQIHQAVNDGPLPSLKLWDEEGKFKISCDWKAMLTIFYGEEAHWHRLMALEDDEKKRVVDRLLDQVTRGGKSDLERIQRAIETCIDWVTASRWSARRARIDRYYKEVTGKNLDWDEVARAIDDDEEEEEGEDEEKAMEKLQMMREMAGPGFGNYLSDSESDVDGGEEEDENGSILFTVV